MSVDPASVSYLRLADYRCICILHSNCILQSPVIRCTCAVLPLYSVFSYARPTVTDPGSAPPQGQGKQKKSGKKAGGTVRQPRDKQLRAQFAEFVRHFNRSYASTEEYTRRMRVFGENMRHARNFQRMERGTAQYGVTKFSDMTGMWTGEGRGGRGR